MDIRGDTSDPAFKTLIERLFLQHRFGPPSNTPVLFVREVPPDWDLRLPDSATVIGSHRVTEFITSVVLDVPGSPEVAAAAIEGPLAGAGWRAQEGFSPHTMGGFVPSGFERTGLGRTLCDDQQRRHLDVQVTDGEGGVSHVRLNLNSDPTNYIPCEERFQHRGPPPSVFPHLSAPPGMTMRGGGGGGGGNSAHSEAFLYGNLDLVAIEAHFRGQLSAAAWTFGGAGVGEHHSWSTWTFTDHGNRWVALFVAAAPEGQQEQVNVYLQATASRPATGGGGYAAMMS